MVRKPVGSAVGSDGEFIFAAYTKKRAFRTQHFAAAACSRLTGNGSSSNIKSVCSTKLRVLAAKFDVRRWPMSQSFSWDL